MGVDTQTTTTVLATCDSKPTPQNRYFIHVPSTEIRLEDSLNEIDKCHKAAKFKEFGLSNFPAWQVVVHQ